MNRGAFLCLGFNVVLHILLYLSMHSPFDFTEMAFFRTMYQIILLGNVILPVIVSFSGVLLGIGSIILKEPNVHKAMLAIVLNIMYIFFYFTISFS